MPAFVLQMSPSLPKWLWPAPNHQDHVNAHTLIHGTRCGVSWHIAQYAAVISTDQPLLYYTTDTTMSSPTTLAPPEFNAVPLLGAPYLGVAVSSMYVFTRVSHAALPMSALLPRTPRFYGLLCTQMYIYWRSEKRKADHWFLKCTVRPILCYFSRNLSAYSRSSFSSGCHSLVCRPSTHAARDECSSAFELSLLDSTQQALATYSIYYYSVLNYSNPAVFLSRFWYAHMEFVRWSDQSSTLGVLSRSVFVRFSWLVLVCGGCLIWW